MRVKVNKSKFDMSVDRSAKRALAMSTKGIDRIADEMFLPIMSRIDKAERKFRTTARAWDSIMSVITKTGGVIVSLNELKAAVMSVSGVRGVNFEKGSGRLWVCHHDYHSAILCSELESDLISVLKHCAYLGMSFCIERINSSSFYLIIPNI